MQTGARPPQPVRPAAALRPAAGLHPAAGLRTKTRPSTLARRRTAWALLASTACSAFGGPALAQVPISSATAAPVPGSSGPAAYRPNPAATSPTPTATTPTSTAATQTAPDAAVGEPVVRLASQNERLRVIERFSKVVTLGDRITRVDGFDQEVVSVTALDSRSVRIYAKSPGVTTMTLIDENNRPWSVDVLVTGDVRHLQEMLTRLFPNAAVEAVEVRDAVLLRGTVTQPDQIPEIVDVARQFYPNVLNQMKVGCVQQVMMRVKILEVQRTKLERLGFNFSYASAGGFLFGIPGLVSPAAIVGPARGAAAAGAGSTTVGFGVVNNNSTFNGFIDALKQEQLLKVHAEPNLVTMNGRPAQLLSGGELPVPVAQGLGNASIQYRPFGTRLEAVPLVLDQARVRIEVFAEVSGLDYSNAVTLNGFTTPALLTRNANTQVELGFGQTLVIAGLIQSIRTGNTQKIPVLGDVPYLGAAFRRVSYNDAETEIVIMLTPELVAPLEPEQVPPGGLGLFTDNPNNRELFGYGVLEVPSFGPHCEGTCPPPIPTYDPHHPLGPENLDVYPALPPGPYSTGSYGPPGYAPPAAYPGPDGYAPGAPAAGPAPFEMPPMSTMPPRQTPVGPTPAGPFPGDAAPLQRELNVPPPAPAAARYRQPGTLAPASYTQPAPYTQPAARRPGLIEPTRPSAGR